MKESQGIQLTSTWVVASYRAGENSQIFALAEALNRSYTVKRLNYNALAPTVGFLRQRSLAGIDRSRSASLEPPWPDLVISAGLRNEPVCRWIRMASGNKTRIVHIGRPWASLNGFDLIITTPQYRLPDHPNVLHNRLTLHTITSSRLEKAALLWAPRFKHLPKPYIGLLVGGDSNPFTFGPNAARRLGNEVSKIAQETGGSILITTSSRTTPDSVTQLRAAIDAPAYLFEWKPGTDENPYLGILALAQRLVVTADSIAMLSEAVAARKPVYVFDPDNSPTDFRWGAWFYRLLMKIGPQRATRDVRLVHRYLFSTARAGKLGKDILERVQKPSEDMNRAVARVNALFDATQATSGKKI